MAIGMLVSGCASIIYGVHQDLEINTTPPGVVARVGNKTCVTPCILNVWRREEEIFISDGVVEKKYELDSHINKLAYWIGNIVWGPFGIIGDGKIGGEYTIDPVNITPSTKVVSEWRLTAPKGANQKDTTKTVTSMPLGAESVKGSNEVIH